MNTTIEISVHPIYNQIKRKVELKPLTIDYAGSVANWPFQVVHFSEAGEELFEVPRANGNFLLNNARFVYPPGHEQAGIKLPDGMSEIPADPETEGSEPISGVPEFEFLRDMLMQPDIDPLVLGNVRIATADARLNFDDYLLLMSL
jgi:hypothetical protein